MGVGIENGRFNNLFYCGSKLYHNLIVCNKPEPHISGTSVLLITAFSFQNSNKGEMVFSNSIL